MWVYIITRSRSANYRKSKGYNLEYYAVLTLEYNGYHVKRNAMSFGVEDLVAVKKKDKLIVQAKSNKKLVGQALSKIGKEILRKHALEHGCKPIFLYKARRGENVWINLATKRRIEFESYTKEWKEKRSTIKKKLSDLKNPKKGGSIEKWEAYVLANYDEVKDFIC